MSVETFTYTARAADGTMRSGELEAETQGHAASRLINQGLTPVDLVAANSGLQTEINLFPPKPPKTKDQAALVSKLSQFLRAGLTAPVALSKLAEQEERTARGRGRAAGKARAGAEALRDLTTQVQGGKTLAEAMSSHPKVFPPLVMNMARAGETDGRQGVAMARAAESLEKQAKLQAKVKKAVRYPLIVMAVALITMAILLIFVIPTFATIFKGLGGQLPTLTRILVAASGWMKIFAPVAIVAGISGTIVWRRIKFKPEVRQIVDPLMMRLPLVGGLITKGAIARTTRTLSALVGSGVKLLEALDIAGATANNVVVKAAMDAIAERIKSGQSLGRAMGQEELFPQIVLSMVETGEETGSMDEMLGNVSDILDEEVDQMADALSATLEPLMLMITAGMVGTVVIGMYLPIFKVFDLING